MIYPVKFYTGILFKFKNAFAMCIIFFLIYYIKVDEILIFAYK